MQDCNNLILELYQHPVLTEFIKTIKPEAIRDDLRQELALTLLEQPCEKLSRIWAENGLIPYAVKTLWRMAYCDTPFSRKYKAKDIQMAARYLESITPAPKIDTTGAQTALESRQSKSAYDYHEYLIFAKYIDLRNVSAVARYYNLPRMHVQQVVNRIQQELKSIIRNA
jgi:hypothetical protein